MQITYELDRYMYIHSMHMYVHVHMSFIFLNAIILTRIILEEWSNNTHITMCVLFTHIRT